MILYTTFAGRDYRRCVCTCTLRCMQYMWCSRFSTVVPNNETTVRKDVINLEHMYTNTHLMYSMTCFWQKLNENTAFPKDFNLKFVSLLPPDFCVKRVYRTPYMDNLSKNSKSVRYSEKCSTALLLKHVQMHYLVPPYASPQPSTILSRAQLYARQK